MVIKCRCDHEYQDVVYGDGKRLHNKMNGKEGYYRCTVCGATNTSGSATGNTTPSKKAKK